MQNTERGDWIEVFSLALVYLAVMSTLGLALWEVATR